MKKKIVASATKAPNMVVNIYLYIPKANHCFAMLKELASVELFLNLKMHLKIRCSAVIPIRNRIANLKATYKSLYLQALQVHISGTHLGLQFSHYFS